MASNAYLNTNIIIDLLDPLRPIRLRKSMKKAQTVVLDFEAIF